MQQHYRSADSSSLWRSPYSVHPYTPQQATLTHRHACCLTVPHIQHFSRACKWHQAYLYTFPHVEITEVNHAVPVLDLPRLWEPCQRDRDQPRCGVERAKEGESRSLLHGSFVHFLRLELIEALVEGEVTHGVIGIHLHELADGYWFGAVGGNGFF